MRNLLLLIITLWFVINHAAYSSPTGNNDIHILRKSISLGDVKMDVTTNHAKAREHFLLGTAFLHAFMYDLAIQQFQAAQKLDPGFAMSYWGEAMSYKHPIWNFEDTAAARNVLSRFNQYRDNRQLTDKEIRYMNAVKTLFAGKSMHDRDLAYISDLKQMYSQYPDDPDIGSFYSLSLLGYASDFPENADSRRNLKLGLQVISDLFRRFPNHPGAVHYYLHYHDVNDKKLAEKALPAADIALTVMRSSSHVTHMASHIYRRLELWDKYIKANQASVNAADTLCKKLGDYPLYACNAENKYHSLEWLQDGYLLTGQYKQAQESVNRIRSVAARDHSVIYKQWYYRMWARQVLISQDWTLQPIKINPITKPGQQLYWSAYSECGALLASAFLAIHNNKSINAQMKRLNSVIQYTNGISDPFIGQTCRIAKLEIQAELSRYQGRKQSAATFMKKALVLQRQQISTELTPSLSFLPANEYYQNYFLSHS